ncbi:MAG: nucleotidyltransferase family protein [Terracidiphilus sp.]
MSREFLSSVIDALRFTADKSADHTDNDCESRALSSYSSYEWSRQIGILDRVGLTLPLYARLLGDRNCVGIPAPAIATLEQRRRDNALRMNGMLITFGHAVKALQNAGVRSVCVKGFSLIPDYLTELWQRHQIDFDLLVAPQDAHRAQQALEELGYRLTAIDRSERRLRIPASRPLTRHAYLYNLQEGAAIELHSEFWDAEGEAHPMRCPLDTFEQAEMHTVGSVSFLRLARHHAFLYQVLHVFRHFLGSWARLLWLYEIAAFMHRHQNDDALWQKVRELLCADVHLTEAAALVLLCAQNLFICRLPPALENVCALPADSPVRLWIDRYARRWLLTDMPGNKLNLLLHRHFISDDRAWRRHLAKRLVPVGNRPMLCEGIDQKAAKSLKYKTANLRFQAARIWHHLGTGAEFTFASIAWEMHLRSDHSACSPNKLRRGES